MLGSNDPENDEGEQTAAVEDNVGATGESNNDEVNGGVEKAESSDTKEEEAKGGAESAFDHVKADENDDGKTTTKV